MSLPRLRARRVEGENLGRNAAGVPDLLGVSLSTHDYVNHAFGPESRESHDHLLQLDRRSRVLLRLPREALRAGKRADRSHRDHGFLNAPEYSSSLGFAGVHVDSQKLLAELNERLAARFGAGTYAVRYSYPRSSWIAS